MNGTITAEQARAALKQYGSERKAAAALGTTRHMLKRIADGHSVVVKQEQSVKNQQSGDTIAVGDMLAGYDTVGRALAMVREIPPGRLRKDESLRSELGISNDRWRAVRSSIRVSGFVYQLPSKEYVWGSKSTIAGIPAKLRELLA